MIGERQSEIDAFKGLLICLIVLGHNTLFSHHYPLAFNGLYNFHVASFLLLPFLFFGKSAAQYQFKDRAVRYLVPHFVFFSIAAVAFLTIFVVKDAPSIVAWLKSVALAILFSSEGTYRAACGFGLFWFLPALLSLVMLRTAYFRGGPVRRRAILAGTLAVHLLLGLIPSAWLQWMPWGWPIVLFLFPLGLIVGAAWQRKINRTPIFVLCMTVFVACLYLARYWPSWSALAGDPGVYAIDAPLRLLFHDVHLVAAFLALLLLCWRLPGFLARGLAYVGDRSLFVFLAHSFVFRAISMSGLLGFLDSWLSIAPVAVVASFGLTLGVTLLLYKMLKAVPRLYMLVFPRSRAEWRLALGAR